MPPKTGLFPAADLLRKLKKESDRKKWENALDFQLKSLNLQYEREALFLESREFRADFLFRMEKLIVEVDGGQWMEKGAHNTGMAIERDRERDANAMMIGYRVLRVTPSMVKDGRALCYIENLLRQKARG